MNISLPSKPSSPGLETQISFKSTPNSFVGVLAVDKSVLLQKSGNDVDKKRVFNDWLQFDSSVNYEPVQINGTESRYEDFGGLNSFILTNALNEPPELSFEERDGDSSEEDMNYEDFFDANFGKNQQKREAGQNSRIRKDFPETWIFQNFTVDGDGQYLLRKNVPDTITSWVVTGFSLDEENGLGISEPQTLVVTQNFFLKLNLPYSIRWGEILQVEILVFNYVPDRKVNLSVDVELFTNESDPDFEFIDKKIKCKYETSTDNFRSNLISVAQNSMATTSFFIKPLKSGKIKLNVKAIGQQVKLVDAIEKEILVEHEGITRYDNQAVMIDLVKGSFGSRRYEFDFSNETIQKSVKVGASVVGDLMGPALLDVSGLM